VAVANCPTDSLPELVAAFEAAKARAWVRLAITPAATEEAAPADHLVGAAEMARLLDLPGHWVRDHARRRLIPSLKVGHYVRFEPTAVIAAVRALGGAQDHPSCSRSIRKRQKSGDLPAATAPVDAPPGHETVHVVDTPGAPRGGRSGRRTQ